MTPPKKPTKAELQKLAAAALATVEQNEAIMSAELDKSETDAIRRGHGKWAGKVPRKGWSCIDIYDNGHGEENHTICEMCETSRIRWVHVMSNPRYKGGNDTLDVGCVCAGHMEEDLVGAQEREANAKRAASNEAAIAQRAAVTGWLEELVKKDPDSGPARTALKWWRDHGFLSPKLLSSVQYGLKKNGIAYEITYFKSRLQRGAHREQIQQMEDWKLQRIRGAFSRSQQALIAKLRAGR